MKKIFLFTLCASIAVSLASCAKNTAAAPSDSDRLAAIESRLDRLEEKNDLAESSFSQRFDALSSLLGKGESTDTEKESDTAPTSDTEPSPRGFTYTLKDGAATVTGYVGDEQSIVIPASIDGYRVVAVGDGAFEDSNIKSVIISDGIESIGWFSFNGCTKLTTVTVPSSVTKIGYSAFGSADSSLTLLCHSDSFALQYAKSYGLGYTII